MGSPSSSSLGVWKIKAWGLTVWMAALSYSAESGREYLALCLVGYVAGVFIMDGSVRMMEDRFISRSKEIEKVLSACAAGDYAGVTECQISTNVPLAGLDQIRKLLSLKRSSFWMPYACVGNNDCGLLRNSHDRS